MAITGMTLTIPPEILNAVRLPPREMEREFRRELALALYQRGALGIGKARQLADMTRWDFEALLGERDIVRQYTANDLEEDLDYGLGHQ